MWAQTGIFGGVARTARSAERLRGCMHSIDCVYVPEFGWALSPAGL